MTIYSKSLAAAIIAVALVPAASFAATKSVSTTTSSTYNTSTNNNYSSIWSDVYVAGQIGWNNPNENDLNNTAVFSGSAGYRFNPNFRLEGEIAYRKNDADLGIPGVSGDAKGTNYMINGWYDFANSTLFTPYVGGGIGWATANEKASGLGITASDHENAFIYQLGAGVAYNLTQKFALTADYRYLNTSNFNYIANEIRGGVRYSF